MRLDIEDACASVLAELHARAHPANVAGMARYGISAEGTLGVKVADVRVLARAVVADHRRDAAWRHGLAACLWDTAIHEARIMATIVDDPSLLTREQAERWILDVDSWDTCDQLCSNLLRRSALAWTLAHEWAARDEQFVKRAAFALAAQLAVHAKDAPADEFRTLLALVRRESEDERPLVRKAVNWSLRQIGKRGGELFDEALELAEELAQSPSRTARWIGRDAARELGALSPERRAGAR